MPSSNTAVIANLLSRKRDEPGSPVEPISDTVRMVARLSNAISKGQDIAPVKTDMVRIISNQPEKSDLFQALMNFVDQERLADMIVTRARVEKEIKRDVESGALTYSECMAVWQFTNSIIETIQNKAAKLNKPVDSTAVFEKVDVNRLQSDQINREKWEGTTPQGRQIIRMKLFELKRYVAVEIEQQKEQATQPAINV